MVFQDNSAVLIPLALQLSVVSDADKQFLFAAGNRIDSIYYQWRISPEDLEMPIEERFRKYWG